MIKLIIFTVIAIIISFIIAYYLIQHHVKICKTLYKKSYTDLQNDIYQVHKVFFENDKEYKRIMKEFSIEIAGLRKLIDYKSIHLCDPVQTKHIEKECCKTSDTNCDNIKNVDRVVRKRKPRKKE